MRTTSDPHQARLAAELRATADSVHDSPSLPISDVPPWPAIEGFMRGSRKPATWAHRFRGPLVVGSAALATAALITLQATVLDPSGSDRGSAMSSSAATRGSLAGNQKFLADLRTWATFYTNFDVEAQSPPAPEKSEGAKNVKVLYASDVGDFRVAVVRADWPNVNDGQTNQAFLYAPKGAAANQMVGDLTVTDLNVVSAFSTFRGKAAAKIDDLHGAGVVLADEPTRVTLHEPPTIDADGKVTQHLSTVRGQDGVYEVDEDKPGLYALALSDGSYQDFQGSHQTVRKSSVVTTPARGGPKYNVDQLVSGELGRGLAQQTWMAARQTFGQGTWTLLAAETGATGESDPHRALVGVLTLPSGARVLAAGHAGPEYDPDVQAVPAAKTRPDSGLDIARLLPAGDDAKAAIAWRMDERKIWVDEADPQDKDTIGYKKTVAPARTAAMGPVGTVKVTWTSRTGQSTTTSAENTLALTDQTDVTSVSFLDADGKELGTAKVLAPEAARAFSFDSTHRATAMEWHQPWLIPDVSKGLKTTNP